MTGQIIFQTDNPQLLAHLIAVLQQNGVQGQAVVGGAPAAPAMAAPPAPAMAPPAPAMAPPPAPAPAMAPPPAPAMAAPPQAPLSAPPSPAPAPAAPAPAAPAAPPAASAPSTGPVNDQNDPNVQGWQNAIKTEMARIANSKGAAAADIVKTALQANGNGQLSLAAIPAGHYPAIHAALQQVQ